VFCVPWSVLAREVDAKSLVTWKADGGVSTLGRGNLSSDAAHTCKGENSFIDAAHTRPTPFKALVPLTVAFPESS